MNKHQYRHANYLETKDNHNFNIADPELEKEFD